MSVRQLRPDEWQTARDVRLRALQESPDAFASSYAEEIERPDSWWEEGARKLAWFVAEDGKNVVGVAAGMPVDEHCEVISMWLDPEHRGRGAADDLVAAVAAWAGARGATGLCLAVAADNDRARRFYERAGFVATQAGEALRSRPSVCTTEMRLEFGAMPPTAPPTPPSPAP